MAWRGNLRGSLHPNPYRQRPSLYKLLQASSGNLLGDIDFALDLGAEEWSEEDFRG